MFSKSVSVFLVVGHTDLRGAFDSLAAVTRNVLGMDPCQSSGSWDHLMPDSPTAWDHLTPDSPASWDHPQVDITHG